MTPSGAAPSSCARCGGQGYVVGRDGAWARARVCDCHIPCARCGGEGHSLRRDERGYVYTAPCLCQALQRRVALFNDVGIPAKFFDRDLHNYQPATAAQSDAQVAADKFVRSYQPGAPGFLLMGPVGTGKTHLVCAVLAQLALEAGVRCRFVDFFHLLHDLRDGFSTNRAMGDLLGPLEDVPVLAIDELGKGKNTEWELSVLDELISKRYNTQKTTLFTTNYTDDPESTYGLAQTDPRAAAIKIAKASAFEKRLLRETLEDRVGPRVYSRLREMCVMRAIDGPDWRALHAPDQRR